MEVSPGSMKELFTGFNLSFNKGLAQPKTYYDVVAMKTQSQSSQENYVWLGQLPGIREWIGDRILNRLTAGKYVIVNKDFERTISVPKNAVEDDKYGIYGPVFQQMGFDVARFPDKLVFQLLAQGFATTCFDDQYFFDTDHPGFDSTGAAVSVSNFGGGAGTPWFLLDCSQPLKPMIYQERRPFQLISKVDERDDNVFWLKDFVYGIDGRCNVGFGMWQLAYASKQTLNEANFTAARLAMMTIRQKSGDPLGIEPTHLFVPPSLDGTARELLKAISDSGSTNVWAGSVQPVSTAWLGN